MAWGMEAAQVSDRGHGMTSVVTTEEQRAAAVRTVARLARDAEDAAQLLDALGLSPEEARP